MTDELSATAEPGEILNAALRKEEAAYRFYEKLLAQSHVEFVRELLEQLRDEEGRHVQLIRKRIAAFEGGRG